MRYLDVSSPIRRPSSPPSRPSSAGCQLAVFIALNYIDTNHKTNLRINTYVDDVSRTGLVLHIDSWCITPSFTPLASVSSHSTKDWFYAM
ncbi:hypothetical protein J3R82DRAFT_10109 [Butyriboletus roseoflavus]|nr:hypothetical protein J3R82DRAFT_10109 [Butyriboletus roseoflavus]